MNIFSSFQESSLELINNSQGLPFPMVLLIALGGGLAASLTPCVLPMIPLYLSYIGATEIKSKLDAIKKSSMFCLGAAIVFFFLGVFASFANFIMVDYRGYINIVIGLFILVMALTMAEIIHLPLPQVVKTIPEGSPIIVGAAFALISSPCASPVLFAIVALSSTVGSTLKSGAVMIMYSIGYTVLIFLISLFGGLAKQFDVFKKNPRTIIVVSSLILGILGVYYLYSGITWFL